jgi:prevent-host-death family protein
MKVTATALRADLYRLLDRVLDSGEPLEIVRHGRTLRLVADPPARVLDGLPVRNSLACTFDELVETSFPFEPVEEP